MSARVVWVDEGADTHTLFVDGKRTDAHVVPWARSGLTIDWWYATIDGVRVVDQSGRVSRKKHLRYMKHAVEVRVLGRAVSS